jgi:hypothetical protein
MLVASVAFCSTKNQRIEINAQKHLMGLMLFNHSLCASDISMWTSVTTHRREGGQKDEWEQEPTKFVVVNCDVENK